MQPGTPRSGGVRVLLRLTKVVGGVEDVKVGCAHTGHSAHQRRPGSELRTTNALDDSPIYDFSGESNCVSVLGWESRRLPHNERRCHTLPGVTMKSAVAAVAFLSVAVIAAGVQAPAAQAAGSAFQGTIYVPDRGGENVVIRGDLTFDPDDCPTVVDGFQVGSIYHHDITIGLIPVTPGEQITVKGAEFSDGGYGSPPVGVSWTDTNYYGVSPGQYRLGIVGRYWSITGGGDAEPVWMSCRVLSQQVISIVEKVSTTLTSKASPARVLLGESVRLSVEETTLWSDGVTTTVPASPYAYGGYALQHRLIGSTEWTTTYNSGTMTTDTPLASTEYRFLQENRLSTPVTVEVIAPTGAVRFGSPTVSPSDVIRGALLVITASAETLYTDGQWRPSPQGTAFGLQFLAEGTSQWLTVGGDVTSRAGVVSAQTTASDSGMYRLVTGEAISAGVMVPVIQPVGVNSFSEPHVPASLKRGGRLRLEADVTSSYTDGVTRPSPPGTSFSVEFASAKRAGVKKSKLRWTTVRTAEVMSTGVALTVMRVATSGFWRLRVDNTAQTKARFVKVRR